MSRGRKPDEVKRLMKWLARKEQVSTGNLFILLQMTVEAMKTRFRWDKRARSHLNPRSKAKGRQLFRESVLEHCYKTALLAGLMVEVEHRAGNTDLNLGRFVLAGALHDVSELFDGDKHYWDRTGSQQQVEVDSFGILTTGFSDETGKFLRDIYLISQPDSKKPYHQWTREQRFFKLIELIGYIKRALAECRAGNLNFASSLAYHLGGNFPHDPLTFKEEFPATIEHWLPKNILDEIKAFVANIPGEVSK